MTSQDAYCWAACPDEGGPPATRDRYAETAAASSRRQHARLTAPYPTAAPRGVRPASAAETWRPRLATDLGTPIRFGQEPAPVVAEVSAERFVGRRAELREISARAAFAAAGLRQTVVVEGRQGIGKTSLLRRAFEQLADFRQLRADCALGGTADQLMSEAGATSRAGPGPSPGRQAGGGLLAVIRALLDDGRPLLLALDNVQWIDAEPAAEIAAVLTGPAAVPLLIIVAAPEPWRADPRGGLSPERLRRQLLSGAGVIRLPVAELSVAETGQLLDRVGPAASEQFTRRLHDYTGGHPGLLSVLLDQGLASAHNNTSPADLLGLFDPLVMNILRSVSRLPEASRELLAAMAVSDETWPLAVVGSVAGVDDPFEALEPLLDSGLVEWSPAETVAPVFVRYPFYRDVIYRSLPRARRQALHAQAASFAIGTRGLAHRVAAARTADPLLAATLAREADRYYLAGENERAGTLLKWSAAVTSDPDERLGRLLQAARWWLRLRAVDWGPRLESCLALWPPSAARSMVLGLIAEAAGRYSQARALLAEAHDLAAGDPRSRSLSRDLDLAAALVHADLGDAPAAYRRAAGLLTLDGLTGAQRGWAEFCAVDARGRMNGAQAALALLARLVPDSMIDDVDAGRGASRDPAGDEVDDQGVRSVRLWARGAWRLLSGRLHDGRDDLIRMLSAADRAAADAVVPVAHAYLGYAHFQLGDWKQAAASVAEAVEALSGHGVLRLRVPVHAVAACVDAAAGHLDSAERHVQAAQRWHAESGPADYAVFPAIAAAAVAQARGDHGRMLAALQPLLADPGPNLGYQAWWQPLHVEALVGTRQLGAAQHALGRLRDLAGGPERPAVTAAWLGALLAAAGSEEFEARARFEHAVAWPSGPDDVPLHRARLEHDYGRFLMSGRNRRAAIGRLRRAYELYRKLGARPFAERCADDLQACGAQATSLTGGQPGGDVPPVLSSRERRIAYLAAQGLTNQEIAGEVFISSKTVEYHLGNVFAKLGISSRRQLPARLGTGPRE